MNCDRHAPGMALLPCPTKGLWPPPNPALAPARPLEPDLPLERPRSQASLAGSAALRWSRVAVLVVMACLTSCGRQPEAESQPTRPERQARRQVRPTFKEDGTTAFDASQSSARATGAPATSQSQDADSAAAQGWVYRNDRIRTGPWSVSLLKIDRARADLAFTTTAGRGRRIGLSTLSEQVETVPADLGRPIAAVNGDFYRTEHDSFAGDSRGLQIMRGELISAPSGKTAFWIDSEGKPNVGDVAPKFRVTWPEGQTTPIGLNEERDSNDAVLYTPRSGTTTRARGGRELVLVRKGTEPWLPLRAGETYTAQVREVRETGNTRLSADILVLSIGPALLSRVPRVSAGATLTLSMATDPDLRGVETALGGGPHLVSNGKVQRTSSNKAYERHPRTAMGWNDTHFFLVQVDGRQPGFSMGMTLGELGSYLAKQGCQEAMNLDGGGSSEMWIEGQVVNRPCFGYERNTANALVLIQKAHATQTAGAPSQAAE